MSTTRSEAAAPKTAAKTKTSVQKRPSGGPEEPVGESQNPHSKVPLHTIIFFPVDYDDPLENGFELATGAHADNALCTGPSPFMFRTPPVSPGFQPYFARNQVPSYFRKPKFDRIVNRLRYNYLDENNDKISRPSYAKRDERNGGSVKYLHQMAVFFELLKEQPYNFRSIYAGNLYTAKRHAKRLTDEIARQNPKSPSLTRTPTSATSRNSSVDPYKNYRSPVSPGGSRLNRDNTYQERVMLLTYRQSSHVLINARVNESFMNEEVLVYPSIREVGWDGAKTYDILAFEAINEKRENMWRPKSHVCSLTNNPAEYVCDIEANHGSRYKGKDQIMKRSHSSCAAYVQSFSWEAWQRYGGCRGSLLAYRKMLEKGDVVIDAADEVPSGQNAPAPTPAAATATASTTAQTGAQTGAQTPAAPATSEDKRAEIEGDIASVLDNSRFYNYIHQEFVKCFSTWGELRVFVATRYVKDASGHETTKREPYIVDIIKTRFLTTKQDKNEFTRTLEKDIKRRDGLAVPDIFSEDDDIIVVDDDHSDGANNARNNRTIGLERCTYTTSNMKVTRYNLESTQNFQRPYNAVNLAAVKKFVLAQYRRLQRRFPRTFKSLDVGTRIDVGIGPDNKSLFINEVTRWWFAAWFCSYDDVDRQATVPRAFAKSFAEVYASAAGNTDEDQDGGDAGGDDDDSADSEFYDDIMEDKEKRETRKAQEANRPATKRARPNPQPMANGPTGNAPPAPKRARPNPQPVANGPTANAQQPVVKGPTANANPPPAGQPAPLTDAEMVAHRDNKTLKNLSRTQMLRWVVAKGNKQYDRNFVPAQNTLMKQVRKELSDLGL